MIEIDWSKAPEGAMYYVPEWGFFRCEHGEWWQFLSSQWITTQYGSPENFSWFDAAIPRPLSPAWNGEGLPPVGTVCEVLYNSEQKTYVPIVVLAHDDAGAVYRFLDGDRKGEYQSEQQEQICGLPNFRPIRTPEQIAAEEREKAVQEMVDRFAIHDVQAVPWRNLFGQMYDACYRKIEP